MNITYKQKKWLDDRGGRTVNDVLQDNKGLYVLMSDGHGGEQKIYLPKNLSNE